MATTSGRSKVTRLGARDDRLMSPEIAIPECERDGAAKAGRGKRGACWSAALFFMAVLVAACSSHSQPGAGATPPRKIRIGLLPVASAAEIGSLRSIMTVPDGAPVRDEPARIQERLAEVTQSMTRSIADRLGASQRYQPVPIPEGRELVRDGEGNPRAQELKRLRDVFGVDAVLDVRLSGYGRLNKKWTTGVIASGSAEAVGEGTLVWLAIGNVPVAIAVMIEEGIRDTVMAIGGVSAFNAGYSPVTLDAALLDAADGRELWSHTAFATTDAKTLDRIPKDDQSKKEVRLQATGEKAIGDLVKHLEVAAETDLEPWARQWATAR